LQSTCRLKRKTRGQQANGPNKTVQQLYASSSGNNSCEIIAIYFFPVIRVAREDSNVGLVSGLHLHELKLSQDPATLEQATPDRTPLRAPLLQTGASVRMHFSVVYRT
jgi:hypothetical protein